MHKRMNMEIHTCFWTQEQQTNILNAERSGNSCFSTQKTFEYMRSGENTKVCTNSIWWHEEHKNCLKGTKVSKFLFLKARKTHKAFWTHEILLKSQKSG